MGYRINTKGVTAEVACICGIELVSGHSTWQASPRPSIPQLYTRAELTPQNWEGLTIDGAEVSPGGDTRIKAWKGGPPQSDKQPVDRRVRALREVTSSEQDLTGILAQEERHEIADGGDDQTPKGLMPTYRETLERPATACGRYQRPSCSRSHNTETKLNLTMGHLVKLAREGKQGSRPSAQPSVERRGDDRHGQ